jgi:hypothetical protein
MMGSIARSHGPSCPLRQCSSESDLGCEPRGQRASPRVRNTSQILKDGAFAAWLMSNNKKLWKGDTLAIINSKKSVDGTQEI